jgi:gas vesicle protein
MNQENKGSNFLEGFLIGGLIGAAIGVFFAPNSGDKTKNLIREKLKGLQLEEILDHFSEAFEAGRQEATAKKKELEGEG